MIKKAGVAGSGFTTSTHLCVTALAQDVPPRWSWTYSGTRNSRSQWTSIARDASALRRRRRPSIALSVAPDVGRLLSALLSTNGSEPTSDVQIALTRPNDGAGGRLDSQPCLQQVRYQLRHASGARKHRRAPPPPQTSEHPGCADEDGGRPGQTNLLSGGDQGRLPASQSQLLRS